MHGTWIHNWIGAEFLCECTQEVAFCILTWVFNHLGIPENFAFHCAWDGACMLSRVSLCNPMDCSPPGASVHGILQARVVEWVAISFSRGSSLPRDRTQVSSIAGGFFTTESPGSLLCLGNSWSHSILPLAVISYLSFKSWLVCLSC